MRIWPVALLLPPVLCSSAAAAPLQGKVVQSEASWAYGGTAIVTESVVEQADGNRVRVHQLGGSASGIGMRLSHAPAILAAGDEVLLETTATQTVSGRTVHSLRQILDLRRAAPSGDKVSETHAFVRTGNASGADIHWASGCALLSVASDGSQDVAGDAEFDVIDQVLSTWRSQTEGCSYFELVNEGREDREVGLDGINLIKFREDFWCRPATKDDPQECYDQAAAGITTLFFVDDAGSKRNGEIIDADIEFNGVQFALAVDGVSAGNQDCIADVANTFTHEIGHLVGLDHTCWIGGPRPDDGNGDQVPMCSGALADDITEATMYNFQGCGEIKKATLEADDVAGLCAIYPAIQDPNECKPATLDTVGCCSIAGSRTTSGRLPASLALLLLATITLLLTRRRLAKP